LTIYFAARDIKANILALVCTSISHSYTQANTQANIQAHDADANVQAYGT
jgi:hypothetical protein